MIPGYISVLLLLIVSILWATGWKDVFAPRMRTGWAVAVTLAIALLLMFPLWSSPLHNKPAIQIHASVWLLLTVCAILLWRSVQDGQRGYLMLCALMLAIVWGSARSLYSHETMFYWMDPLWDMPLLAGLLCGAFTSDSRHQLVLVAWGAALGSFVEVLFRGDVIQTRIGSWEWWDSVAIACCSAVAVTVLLRAGRAIGSRIGAAWLHLRGGRSS
ncbi:hypothetical protein D3P07_07335 [Paenibacillus sp. 1011MAR3C5]|uniref:YphA family membrane protein n=1 Tax=Paenibacillus sp. 1011MAR3C5 TaxID=1675787 RepID=UPI000E6D0514|nr:hypothetical protein [Paenibacillus sp. 1011MAR3C5]RJE90022.1 hypothetical protein D3P07_07335 [Paenibacillus sp. 1011MAR3C5]